MTRNLVLTATTDLRVGDVIVYPEHDARMYVLPISAEHPGTEVRVTATPAPWVLTAGPKAGTVARSGRGKNAPELYRVPTEDVDPAKPLGALISATAEQTFHVVRDAAPANPCARCGDGPSAAYGDDVPADHVDHICAECLAERAAELAL